MTATTVGPLNSGLFDERCKAILGEDTTEQAKADLVGSDPSTVHRFRKGEMSPRLVVARRWASVLGVSVDELWPQS
jgi:hypothetical protein